MSPMMYVVFIVICVGIVSSEETKPPVTVNQATSVTPKSSNSSSRVLIENKVRNLTVKYNSDHEQNRTHVVDQSPSKQATEKPLIITTSKEMRIIQTQPRNDSLAVANTQSKNNSTLRHPNLIKHGRTHNKNHQPSHFLPTVMPESSSKFNNTSKYSTPSKSANSTEVDTQRSNDKPTNNRTNTSNHNAHQKSNLQFRHPAQRHEQPAQSHQQPAKHANFNNVKTRKGDMGHASEIEMEKVELKEMRYVESPTDNKKFRYYMTADDSGGDKSPSTSSQSFEMTFANKSDQKNHHSQSKLMDKYKVRSKPYSNNNNNKNNNNNQNTHNNNQNLHNIENVNHYSTHTPVQYLTPPPPIVYTVRPRITDIDNISITTAAPSYTIPNESNQLAAKVYPRSGPRDFSCLRCFGRNKQQQNYKYPTYSNSRDPILEGSRAVKLLGPDGDNFLGGSKHHYVVVKPGEAKQTNATLYQKGKKQRTSPETLNNKVKEIITPKRSKTTVPTGKTNTTMLKRPENPKSPALSGKPEVPNVQLDGLGSYASRNMKRQVVSTNSDKSRGNSTARLRSLSQKTRNPYMKDGKQALANNFASSNSEFSVSEPDVRGTQSPYKSSDLYHLDHELQASASFMHKHHPEIQVETKEIHIPVPEIVETRVPYPIHIKVDRPVPVHIDKPYPVHIEKKIPVPVKVNVPQPYPVEKEVPYPVKIPIEVPRPVEVPKPVPYLVEHPVPIQVFKHVEVPVRVPVDVPVPYKVHLEVEKRVPYFVSKKVPFEVPVPVEKPYLVEVKKLLEVPREKPFPIVVEKKIPVPVQVVEYVKVPTAVHPPHEQHHQHNIQHRNGELSVQNQQTASAQSEQLVKIAIDPNNQRTPETQLSTDQAQASTNQSPPKMKVVLPNTISLEFPEGFHHLPTGPASGFLPTASGAQT